MSSENKNRVQQVVVGAVIFNSLGKALVVRRPITEDVLPGFYELPSGKKEIGEGTYDALKREVKEETGLDFFIARAFDVFDYNVEKPTFIRETTQINFLIKLDAESPKVILSEHDDYKWVSLDELSVLKMSDKTRETIVSAFNGL